VKVRKDVLYLKMVKKWSKRVVVNTERIVSPYKYCDGTVIISFLLFHSHNICINL
jgi:hypothetical protein